MVLTRISLGYRIVYTAETETTDDKAKMVNGLYTKRPVIFRGNINGDFHNINYEIQNTDEYYGDDDDETRQIVPNGDIV